MRLLVIVSALVASAWAVDEGCTGQGGHCQTDTTACSGHYQSGLCSGAANRRCCLPATSVAAGGTSCFGTIDSLTPTGIHGTGVSGSQRAVDAHISALNSLKSCYIQVGHDNCIEPAVIAALASRESNGGDALAADGTGDGGHAWGILQCDFTHSGLACKSCGAKTCCHIRMMVEHLLIPYIKQVQARHADWPAAHQMQGGVAAYNFGVGNVHSWAGLDQGSTGNDYSNDVIARAKYLKSHYGYV